MKIHSLFFGLTLAILFAGLHSATLIVENSCSYTIWPATFSSGGAAQLSNTGFELFSQTSTSLDAPDSWTGRIWARTQCKSDSSGRFTCATADCGSNKVACNGGAGTPPASLVEFTLSSNGGQDFYDISLVDGFNLPVSISPLGGSGATCTNISCAANVNVVCPSELALRDQESDGSIIGCKTACEVFNQPQYCCTGKYNSPDTCTATNYSMIFKNQCPQAYSFAYDDRSSTFSCTGGPNYLITFCPGHMKTFLSCTLYFSKT